MKSKIIHLILNYPKILISICLVLFLISLSGTRKIGKNYDQKSWFHPTDPVLKNFDNFKAKYGSESSIIILLDFKKNIFTENNLKKLYDITEEIWTVPKVQRVTSLVNAPYSSGTDDSIESHPFIQGAEEIAWNAKYFAEKEKIAATEESFQNFLVSNDLKTTAIYVTLNRKKGEEAKTSITVLERLNSQIKKKYQSDDLDIRFTGTSAVGAAFEKETFKDLQLILPLAFFSLFFILLIYFKNIKLTVLSIVLIGMTVSITMGIQGFLGIKLDVVTGMTPIVVFAISLTDLIHLLSTYRKSDKDSKEALRESLDKNLFPTLLTTATTMIGFLSFLNADIQPVVQLGIICSIGVAVAWIYTIFFLAPLVSIFDTQKMKSLEGIDYKINVRRLYYFISRSYKEITILAILLAFIAGVFAMKNTPNSNMQTYFSPETNFRKANELFIEKIGGTNTAEILITNPNGINESSFLKKVDHFQEELKDLDKVTKINSIIYQIKRLNQLMNSDNTEFFKIPSQDQHIAEHLFFLEMSQPPGQSIYNSISRDQKEIRLTLIWKRSEAKDVLNGKEEIEKLLRKHQLNGHITGSLPLLALLDKYIVYSFLNSAIYVVIFTFIFMLIAFRSLQITVMSLLPNLIAPLFGAAAIYLAGGAFDVGCILIFSITMGIAIDDTIYFLVNLKRYQERGFQTKYAISHVLNATANTLMFTTFTLVVVFSLFWLGSFMPYKNFAIATSTTLISALAIDLMVLPSLLLCQIKISNSLKSFVSVFSKDKTTPST